MVWVMCCVCVCMFAHVIARVSACNRMSSYIYVCAGLLRFMVCVCMCVCMCLIAFL